MSYFCNQCGAKYSSWAGRCNQCGEWNSLQEEVDLSSTSAARKKAGRQLKASSLKKSLETPESRILTMFNDIDEVLGGGLVQGAVVLLAGQPGIGKSTVLMQLASNIAQDNKVLYVSGEESEHQIAMRAKRLGVNAGGLALAATNSADDIAATIGSEDYKVVIVDSIQTVTCESVASAPGSVSQITNSTNLLLNAAKSHNTALILVGHVTKEGSIAGPKILEHIVDVVLQLEGDAYGGFKLLRAQKNRFGPTSEAAILEMTGRGLVAVDNPSEALLKERQISDGSVVLATIEGTRPLLVEVQALVNKTSYGYPKRAASGIDLNRVNLLIAMLERRTKLKLADYDIYINIVGGIRLNDTAADLAICMAIGSAAKEMQLSKNAVVFGEVGLSGEVRHVVHADKRTKEAKKLGFDCVVGPRKFKKSKDNDSFYHEVTDVRQALNDFLKK